MVRGLRKQKGFTLVEVIVVAVIVAALAAVAIGVYLNYVTSSRENTATNVGGGLSSFCGACVNSAGTLTAPAGDGGTWKCNAGAASETSIIIPAEMTVTAPTSLTASGSFTVKHKKVTSAAVTYSY